MNTKEKIQALEKEIESLKDKVKVLEKQNEVMELLKKIEKNQPASIPYPVPYPVPYVPPYYRPYNPYGTGPVWIVDPTGTWVSSDIPATNGFVSVGTNTLQLTA